MSMKKRKMDITHKNSKKALGNCEYKDQVVIGIGASYMQMDAERRTDLITQEPMNWNGLYEMLQSRQSIVAALPDAGINDYSKEVDIFKTGHPDDY